MNMNLILMKKILIAAVALLVTAAPAALAQPGPRPGAKPDTEKKDEPEKHGC